MGSSSDDDFSPRRQACTAVTHAPRQHAFSGKREKKNHKDTRKTSAYLKTPRLFTVLMEVQGRETPVTLDSACTVCLLHEDFVDQSVIVPTAHQIFAANGDEFPCHGFADVEIGCTGFKATHRMYVHSSPEPHLRVLLGATFLESFSGIINYFTNEFAFKSCNKWLYLDREELPYVRSTYAPPLQARTPHLVNAIQPSQDLPLDCEKDIFSTHRTVYSIEEETWAPHEWKFIVFSTFPFNITSRSLLLPKTLFHAPHLVMFETLFYPDDDPYLLVVNTSNEYVSLPLKLN